MWANCSARFTDSLEPFFDRLRSFSGLDTSSDFCLLCSSRTACSTVFLLSFLFMEARIDIMSSKPRIQKSAEGFLRLNWMISLFFASISPSSFFVYQMPFFSFLPSSISESIALLTILVEKRTARCVSTDFRKYCILSSDFLSPPPRNIIGMELAEIELPW